MSYCITKELRDQQIEHSLTRTKNRLAVQSEMPFSADCFGRFWSKPCDTWKEVELFHVGNDLLGGAQISAEKTDSSPHYQLEADPRPHKSDTNRTTKPDHRIPDRLYLPQIVWDLLEGLNTTLWHVFDPEQRRCVCYP